MAPFGAKTTAQQVVQGLDLSGKGALVTGGNSGIGAKTVEALASAGADVILTSRSLEAGQKVADEINAGGVKGSVSVVPLDLADLSSVHTLSHNLVQQKQRLDMVVCNAGVMACPEQRTKEGFELQIGTNVHGHVALIEDLLPHLKSQGHPVRVVVLSSIAHNMPSWQAPRPLVKMDDMHFLHGRKYAAWTAYTQSKLGNIYMAKHLANREQGSNVKFYAVHPGVIRTKLGRHSKGFKFMTTFMPWAMSVKSVEAGAATSCYAATSPAVENHSGAYLADCNIAEPSNLACNADLAAQFYHHVLSEVKAGKPL